MLSWIPRFVLLLLPLAATAQQSADAVAELVPRAWSAIQPQLEDSRHVSDYSVIEQSVNEACGNDQDCQLELLEGLMYKLEDVYHLPAAIYAAETILRIAEKNERFSWMGKAHAELMRFHGALGNEELATANLENAIHYAGLAGDRDRVLHLEFTKLENAIDFADPDEAFAALDSFLVGVTVRGDSSAVTHAHLRLMSAKLQAGRLTEAEAHLREVEKLNLSPPYTPQEAAAVLIAAITRGDLAVARGQLEAAKEHYRRALQLTEEDASFWLEILVHTSLAEVEWTTGNHRRAWKLIETARQKAADRALHDLLARVYELSARIAEDERDYARALGYYRQQQAHLDTFSHRSEGFDLRAYYLNQEKEQLATVKENQALQLELQSTRNRILTASFVAVCVVVIGLLLSTRYQQQSRKRLTEQNALIAAQAERLRELDRSKSVFFTNVSHELRTPLSLILGPIGSLVDDDQLSTRHRELLKMVQRSGRRLETLVNDILNLSKLDSDQIQSDPTPTLLTPYFERRLGDFVSLAGSLAIRYTYHLDIPEGAKANLDREKCRQILDNLLSNALKFTPEGGSITVNVKYAAGQLQLTVRDSGRGIPAQDLTRIFDRYFQSSQPDHVAEGGAGIGLALSRRYARLLGGDIEAESEPGRGSSFCVYFPLEPIADPATPVIDVAPVAPAPAASVASLPTGKPRIIVVEDNFELQEYLRLILEPTYHLTVARHGREALSLLKIEGRHIDLILTDLMMPHMDGFQLIEEVKRDAILQDIPVVVLTARSDARARLRTLQYGIHDYLLKPFSQDELLARLASLLRNRQKRVDYRAKEENPSSHNGADLAWLEEFQAHVQAHYADAALDVPSLARTFAMSESTLLRKLKLLTGLGPKKYLQEIRLQIARQRLEDHDPVTLQQLAQDVGFRSARSFSRSFRQRFGKKPSEYAAD
ncbi:signal transduction histidine kinase/DNA-binding response OmpR family regulator [Lewinella aquimaris]|uniref:histidine kinase n=1 Tax=Neolewinella aquimaris TaxID=1835722 RepID=A0A840E5A9_9BACT|nr:ATP-binding protein [Neolewinella aquimaris]MBB4080361.1 signal transduction histidine kinase/DNA-binding response OmpR family regulator [Neolewinella aquimaris]